MKYYKGDIVEPLMFNMGTKNIEASEPKRIERVITTSDTKFGYVLLEGALCYIRMNGIRLYHRPILNHVKAFFNFK